MTTSWEREKKLIENCFRQCQFENIDWHGVEADGNCLYRALAKEILGDEEQHRIIRFLIIYYLNLNLAHFENLIQYKLDGYVNSQFINGAYGDLVSIYVASWLFEVTFIKYTFNMLNNI